MPSIRWTAAGCSTAGFPVGVGMPRTVPLNGAGGESQSPTRARMELHPGAREPLTPFYREILKIRDRMDRFDTVREYWESKADVRA